MTRLRQITVDALVHQRREERDRQPMIEAPAESLTEARIYANREAMITTLGKQGRIAELGVDDGDFTDFLLTALNPDEFVLIDMWESRRYRSKEDFVAKRFGGDKRIVVDKGLSTDRLAAYPDGSFDFIYIDTNHSYDTTIEELRLAKRKSRPGGVIAGHDFCTGNIINGVVYGVITAVTQFLAEGGVSLTGLSLEPHGHFSFMIQVDP